MPTSIKFIQQVRKELPDSSIERAWELYTSEFSKKKKKKKEANRPKNITIFLQKLYNKRFKNKTILARNM